MSILEDLDRAAARKWQGDPACQQAGLFARAAAEIRRWQALALRAADEPNIDRARALVDAELRGHNVGHNRPAEGRSG